MMFGLDGEVITVNTLHNSGSRVSSTALDDLDSALRMNGERCKPHNVEVDKL